jgi:hypothetical protein
MRAKTLVIAVVMALVLALPGPILGASSGPHSRDGTIIDSDSGGLLTPVPNGQGLGPWPLLL